MHLFKGARHTHIKNFNAPPFYCYNNPVMESWAISLRKKGKTQRVGDSGQTKVNTTSQSTQLNCAPTTTLYWLPVMLRHTHTLFWNLLSLLVVQHTDRHHHHRSTIGANNIWLCEACILSIRMLNVL